MPDGKVTSYDSAGDLTQIQDPFGNTVTITHEGANTVVRQYFQGGSVYRQVSWATQQTPDSLPPSMTYSSNPPGPLGPLVWSYTTEPSGAGVLMKAISPENTTWQYYTNTTDLSGVVSRRGDTITRMVTPSGGQVDYAYDDYPTTIQTCDPPQDDPACFLKTLIVVSRTAGGTIPAGTWTYHYPPFAGGAGQPTVINNYNNMGRKTRESLPYCTGGGCAAPAFVSYDYDDVGRVVRETNRSLRQDGYNGHIEVQVRTANIAQLRDRLTHYLREVRAGQEIVVRDRQRPIARIVPIAPDAESDDRELISAGLMRKATQDLPSTFWRIKRSAVTVRTAAAAVSDDRADR